MRKLFIDKFACSTVVSCRIIVAYSSDFGSLARGSACADAEFRALRSRSEKSKRLLASDSLSGRHRAQREQSAQSHGHRPGFPAAAKLELNYPNTELFSLFKSDYPTALAQQDLSWADPSELKFGCTMH